MPKIWSFKELDKFGSSITFRENRRKHFKTNTGACLTLFGGILLFIYATALAYIMIMREANVNYDYLEKNVLAEDQVLDYNET